MKIMKPTPSMSGVGRQAAFISRFMNVHVWQGTFAAWTVCIRVFRWGGCWNFGEPW